MIYYVFFQRLSRSVLSGNFFQIKQESDLKLSSIWQQLLLLQGQLMGEFYHLEL